MFKDCEVNKKSQYWKYQKRLSIYVHIFLMKKQIFDKIHGNIGIK